jgi:hypothetical protein
MKDAQFVESTSVTHLAYAQVTSILANTVTVRFGSTSKTVQVAFPLRAQDLVVGDQVGLLWFGETPYAICRLGKQP